MNTINALSAIKAIGSATSDKGSRQQFQQQAQQGQTFTATVLESAGKNRVYLEIFGDKILASSDKVSLAPGTRLDLEVIATKPLLELRIISKTPELFFGKTLTLLGKNLDISMLFKALTPSSSALLGQLSPTVQEGLTEFKSLQQMHFGDKNSGLQLQNLLGRLGLNLETLLAQGSNSEAGKTLKAALLEIAAILRGGGQIAESANRLLGTLELYQLAQLRLATENMLIFPLPLPFLDNGYLLVQQDTQKDSDKKEEDSLRFSLHLALEPLGDIEIIFLQTKEGLYIRFACDSKEKKEFANEFQSDLKEMITSSDVLGLSFTDTAGNAANDLVQQLVPDGESMLDTKI